MAFSPWFTENPLYFAFRKQYHCCNSTTQTQKVQEMVVFHKTQLYCCFIRISRVKTIFPNEWWWYGNYSFDEVQSDLSRMSSNWNWFMSCLDKILCYYDYCKSKQCFWKIVKMLFLDWQKVEFWWNISNQNSKNLHWFLSIDSLSRGGLSFKGRISCHTSVWTQYYPLLCSVISVEH